MMVKQNHSDTAPHGIHGSSLYEGYMVDLLDLIAESLELRYRLVPVWDGKYGFRQADGSWNGMVGELMRRVRISL